MFYYGNINGNLLKLAHWLVDNDDEKSFPAELLQRSGPGTGRIKA